MSCSFPSKRTTTSSAPWENRHSAVGTVPLIPLSLVAKGHELSFGGKRAPFFLTSPIGKKLSDLLSMENQNPKTFKAFKKTIDTNQRRSMAGQGSKLSYCWLNELLVSVWKVQDEQGFCFLNVTYNCILNLSCKINYTYWAKKHKFVSSGFTICTVFNILHPSEAKALQC